jgi:hypothetical protein
LINKKRRSVYEFKDLYNIHDFIYFNVSLFMVSLSWMTSTYAQNISQSLPLTMVQGLETELSEALDLYNAQSAERWILATDPNERYEQNFNYQFVANLLKKGEYDLLFQLVDEAFESEFDRYGGASSQHSIKQEGYAPIHQGELGGLDGASCRSCHFSGGPDGAGSGSQLAMLRGDGRYLSSATLRDPPHIMGLGYIQLLAQNMQKDIDRLINQVKFNARLLKHKQSVLLETHGIQFGRLSALPDQSIDTSQVKGISKDLIIRPFGWKGRHQDLATLCDEALQVHHGLQSESRIRAYPDPKQQKIYLGDGPAYDRDQDDKSSELGDGQALGLALYLSLIGIPRMKTPSHTELILPWSRGQEHFKQIGCATCHTPMIRTRWHTVILKQKGSSNTLEVNLKEGGQDPQVRQLDFAPNAHNQIELGAPLFLFSDLKRHDMGVNLADKVDEVLPNGKGKVDKQEWLTRSLWGLADTAPYLHDGRAQNVDEAILWHGGEAKQSRLLYTQLSSQEKSELRLFLMSLSRESILLVE